MSRKHQLKREARQHYHEGRKKWKQAHEPDYSVWLWIVGAVIVAVALFG